MKILALDTSSYHGSFALVENGQSLVEIGGEFGARQSELILGQVEHLLGIVRWQKSDLDGIVVGLGPGSFTGLRVGMATAHGLAFALKRPLYGVSSLDALAQTAPAGPSLLAVCIDARKKELYVRFYRRQLESRKETLPPAEPISPHLLLSPDGLAQELIERDEAALLVGNGSTLYHELLQSRAEHPVCVPQAVSSFKLSATQLALLAQPQILEGQALPPHEIQPIYIRPSDAELNIGPPTGGPPLKGRIAPDGSILPEPS